MRRRLISNLQGIPTSAVAVYSRAGNLHEERVYRGGKWCLSAAYSTSGLVVWLDSYKCTRRTCHPHLRLVMEPLVLLEKLRVLLATSPPLEGRGNYGQEQFAWLGRASALISAWDQSEGILFGVTAKCLAGNMNREMNVAAVFTTIHKAIATLECALPHSAGQAFGPGAAYDFFRALRELVAAVDTSLFVVDPYMDAETFDGYLSSLPSGRSVRLLFSRFAQDVRVAAKKFTAQHAGQLEVKRSDDLHDRIVFVDGSQCWVLGASIKDAALKKPTYLAPLAPEVAATKAQIYEGIWKAAAAI